VDLSRATGVVGVALLALAGWLVGVDGTAIAAGGVAALALTTTDRGSAGLAAASLGLAVAALLLADAVAAASSVPFVATTLSVVVGVAAGVRATVGGRPGGLRAAWTAIALVGVGVLATRSARPDPLVSLLGARLATAPVGWLLLVAPLAIGGVAGSLALARFRAADLPARYATAGPPGAVVLVGLLAGPGVPDVAATLAGTPDPRLAVLLWTVAAAAAADHRFRRPAAWLAAAAGPLAVAPVVLVRGGVFVDALVAAVPGAGVAVGAALETGHPTVVTALVGATFLALFGAGAAAPTLSPRARRLLDGRAAEVAAAGLLVAVATTPPRGHAVAVGGGVAVLAWLLVADRPRITPPRTRLERTGWVTIAAAAGTLFAVRGVGLLPHPEPGLGGLLLLAGVAVLGVAIAE
jgi:hypothetical protein